MAAVESTVCQEAFLAVSTLDFQILDGSSRKCDGKAAGIGQCDGEKGCKKERAPGLRCVPCIVELAGALHLLCVERHGIAAFPDGGCRGGAS
jgi:hypothetical protein